MAQAVATSAIIMDVLKPIFGANEDLSRFVYNYRCECSTELSMTIIGKLPAAIPPFIVLSFMLPSGMRATAPITNLAGAKALPLPHIAVLLLHYLIHFPETRHQSSSPHQQPTILSPAPTPVFSVAKPSF